MEYTYRVDENGKVFRLHVETDDEPWNPREDMDGNIGTMFCMYGRYKLGDKTKFLDSLGMKYAMLQDAGITPEKVIKLAKKNDEMLHIRLVYDRHQKMWELQEKCQDDSYSPIASEHYLDYLEEDVVSALSVQEIMDISKGKLVALPLFLMDHSGLSMQTSDFNDRWDSGQVGWIWSSIKKAEKITGLKNMSTEEIQTRLNHEVKMYSQYLEDDVYRYIVEEYRTGEWTEDESVWGNYPLIYDKLVEASNKVFGEGNWSYSEPEPPDPKPSRADKIEK